MADSAIVTGAIEGFLSLFGVAVLYFFMQGVVKWANKQLAVPRAAAQDDVFSTQYGYSWDFVLVLKVWEEHKKDGMTQFQSVYSMKHIVDRLNNGGLETNCFFSARKDEVYIKIRASPKRLMAEAARIKYSLQLNPERVRAKAQYGRRVDGKDVWKKVIITDDFRVSKYMWYDYIYGKFDLNPELQAMWRITSNGSIFRGVDRIKLIISCMQAKTSDNPPGCGLDLDQLIKYNCLSAAFSLHDYKELKAIQENWLRLFYFPWNMPLEDIKNYFGEKIGLYFAFLSHYVSLLLVPAIIGGLVYMVQQLPVEGLEYLNIIYSFGMIMWNSLFQELWRQKQATLSMEWGVKGYLSSEQSRPQYDGVPSKSPIDGADMLYFPENVKQGRFIWSTTITFVIISLVIAYIAAIFFIQQIDFGSHYEIKGYNYILPIVETFNSIMIQVLNYVYTWVAITLNDWENHRTDTEYEDQLIVKIFGFQVINSYAQIVYVAFIKTTADCLPANDCMKLVQSRLGSIFVARLIVANLTIFITPVINRMLTRKADPRSSPIELEFYKEEFDVLIGTLKDYAEIIIQFGFTTMFVAAYSAAPTIAFVSGYVLIRVNGWKLCQAYRRPSPKTAENIGTWESMLDIISALTVISNFALIFFSASFFINMTTDMRVCIFLAIEHVVFIMKFIVNLNIADIPEEVQIQLDRQEFLVSKILLNKADDVDDQYIANDTNLNLIINETDPDWDMESTDKLA